VDKEVDLRQYYVRIESKQDPAIFENWSIMGIYSSRLFQAACDRSGLAPDELLSMLARGEITVETDNGNGDGVKIRMIRGIMILRADLKCRAPADGQELAERI
jgi:hypothetical protein